MIDKAKKAIKHIKQLQTTRENEIMGREFVIKLYVIMTFP